MTVPRRERPLFDRVVDLGEDDVVDLVECEAGGLDRRVDHAQLLELDLELVKVPLAFLPEAVDGEAQHALFSVVQVLDAYARGAAEAELPSRLDVLVQSKRNKHAALKLMRKLLKKYAFVPERLVTDDLRSYSAAVRDLGIECRHERGLWKK